MSNEPAATMSAVIDRKRYSVADATEIASDHYWDGSNWERHGRNTFLYRTPKGGYFSVTTTLWQGERDEIHPLTAEAAADLYEQLPEHAVEFEEAFPDIPIESA